MMCEGGGSKFFKPVMSTYQPVLFSSQMKQGGVNEPGFKEFFVFDAAGGMVYDSGDAQFVSLDAAAEIIRGKRAETEGKSVKNLRYSNNNQQPRHSFGATVAVRQQNAVI